MNIVVCGALFRPLQWELEDDSDDESESSSSESESDSESSESELENTPTSKASHHSLQTLLKHSPPEPLNNQTPIQFTENNLVNSTSTRMLKRINSRPRLMKGFSSDTCLNYKDNCYQQDLQMPLNQSANESDSKNKIEALSQNFAEFDNTNRSVKSLNLFSNCKPVDKHK